MPQQPVPHHVEDEQASRPSSRKQTRQSRSWLAGLVARDPRLYAIYVEVRPQLLLATLAALLVGVANALLPDALTVGPPWLLLAITGAVVVPLFYALLFRSLPHRLVRSIRFGLQVVLTLALLGSISLLIAQLPNLKVGGELLRSGGLLWVSNIVIFALWYWEIDGDGPIGRHLRGHPASDFQFPQQAGGQSWAPGFFDYLFLAFCSATALSPADTMPLTQRAKLLMMLQAVISLTLLALLIAR
ncbi:MAG TPA: hypothetical protein VF510_09250, partial [Ktedonobacterales bacterium]